MAETTLENLSGVAETLLIPLTVRALETERPDALFRDETALYLIQKTGRDPEQLLADISEESRVAVVLRSREFDRRVQKFLKEHTEAAVVQLGCGLDTRFLRVDDGRVEWFDLDLPEVIGLRRRLIGGEGVRHHSLAHSALDLTWLEALSACQNRPFLFLAESVLIYFDEAQVRSLVLTLQANFPGAELLFDAFTPFFIWANNLRVSRTGIGVRCSWGLKRPRDLERWGRGIRLLDQWYPYECPEPRLGKVRSARFIPGLLRVTGLYHYRLEAR